MDLAKIEGEFEFYGFTLDELKVEFETQFQKHCHRRVEKFSNAVIEAAKQQISFETGEKISALAKNARNLTKPTTIKMLSKTNALIDKHFTIPSTLQIDESVSDQNTPEMYDCERQFKEEIAQHELLYKQQAIMMMELKKELELYDSELMNEAENDETICDKLEEHFAESNVHEEVIDNVVKTLKDITMNSK